MKNKEAEKKKQQIPATKHHLMVNEIKEDTVVMKDGTLRAVLMVSSINFALKNEDEQTAIISSYVSFLNSLDHPLQILIQSRALNIAPYLSKLTKLESKQTNELLRVQIADYRSFVAQLVEMGNITSKNFYVIVPYDPLSNKSKSFFARAGELINPATTVHLKEKRFQTRKNDLDMRVRLVSGGLQGMGLEVVRLDTQSLIELFYSTYNPDIALAEPLPEINKLQVEGQ